jgi:hypothetical protein
MKSSTKIGIIACFTILLAFSLSIAFAENEKTNATKSVNMTSVTKNITNAAKNIINITKSVNMTSVTKNMTNAAKNIINVTRT